MRCAKMTVVASVTVMMVLACGAARGADYFLAPTGADANPGTRAAPWLTLAKAGATAQAGDTVTLLAGEYPGTLAPANSGTVEQPIVFRAEPRRSARLIGNGDISYSILLHNLSHIRIEGLYIGPQPKQGRWAQLLNCSHVTIDDCRMEGSQGWREPMSFSHSTDIQMRNCLMHRHVGINMLQIGHCTRVLIEGNAISRVGHSPVYLWPRGSNRNVVMRGNVFHAAWGRNFEHFGTQETLFEHNIITHAFNSGRSGSANVKFATTRGIFRFNRVFRNPHGAIHLYPSTNMELDTMRLYNNVFDDNGHYGIAVSPTADQTRDLIFANNIFSRNDPHGTHRQIRLGGGTAELVRLMNNVLTATTPGLPIVVDHGGSHTVADVQAEPFLAAHGPRYVGNVDVDPGYTNPTIYDHSLRADSPLRDAGMFLTRTVGAGQGTLLAVEDVAPFYDGYGIQGERGDLIAVGTADRRARVVKVDHQANTLLLDRDLNWQTGDAVSLPWSGEAPDIGVYEHGTAGRAAVQVLVEPFAVRPGQEVTLSAVVHGDAQPREVRWWLGDGNVATGARITHRYAEAYDYAVRVLVIDAAGQAHRAAGYVWVAEPVDRTKPLVHSTWNADDQDAWWLWKSYRPMPATFRDIVDSETGHGYRHVVAAEDNVHLPAQIHPVGWDIDVYPRVFIRYRVSQGTPIVLVLRTFSEKRAVVAASATAEVEEGRRIADFVLHDDGEWQELEFDARMIRKIEPELQVLEGLHIIDWPQSAVKKDHSFDLDEVIIGPQQ